MPNPHPPCPLCGPRRRHAIRSCPELKERMDRLSESIRNDLLPIPEGNPILRKMRDAINILLGEQS